MTEILRAAAHTTNDIIQEADLATTLLAGPSERGRKNGFGILADPSTYLIALHSARAAIERAIMLHEQAAWPTDRDYDDA